MRGFSAQVKLEIRKQFISIILYIRETNVFATLIFGERYLNRWKLNYRAVLIVYKQKLNSVDLFKKFSNNVTLRGHNKLFVGWPIKILK